MMYLRQSTASQEVPLGRFVDSTDGNTEETGLTIANTDIKIWKTGATSLADKNSGGATHIANGEYYCVLDATDTDTIGPLKITIHVAGALYVQVWCCVLDEAVYDVLFGTTALATTGNLTSSTVGTVTTLTNLPAITSNWLTAAGLASDAVNEIADGILTRNVSNVEGTAGEHTLCTVVLATLEHSISGTTLTIKRTDGSTTHATKTLTTDAAADPITGIQ